MTGPLVPTVNFLPLPAQRAALESNEPVTVYSGGIGSGKSYTGAIWCGLRPAGSKILVVAPSYRILRDGTIATLQRIYPWGVWHKTDMTFTLPNGTTLILRSAEGIDATVRSVEPDHLWLEEAAHIPRGAVNTARGRLRASRNGRTLVTSNPRKGAAIWDLWVREPIAGVRLITAKTSDNPAISRAMIAQLRRDYGERLSAQELDGEWIDVVGGLWDSIPYGTPPRKFQQIAIGVDPPAGAGECGIVVGALDEDGHAWILDDASGRYSATEWPATVVELYEDVRRMYRCPVTVVGEINNGGDMVETLLRIANKSVRVATVRAVKSKRERAAPIASAYRQGLVSHAAIFPRLESQMMTWDPDTSDGSPDRMDAMVWAMTHLDVHTRSGGGPWSNRGVTKSIGWSSTRPSSPGDSPRV
jgi:phage terminase large subunit-like protein